jgi:hypothetical protein
LLLLLLLLRFLLLVLLVLLVLVVLLVLLVLVVVPRKQHQGRPDTPARQPGRGQDVPRLADRRPGAKPHFTS